MKKTILLLGFILFSIISTFAQGARYYVSAAAAGANNGASWTDAFTDLQAALQLAQPGDEVWVAEGLYKPTDSTDRNVSFEPKSGVKLFGGFAGTESSPAHRDWEVHPSVLSGDIGMPGDSTDNTYTILYLHEPDSSTLLDGFVLRDGMADYSGLGDSRERRKCGGGLYIMGADAEAYATIRNCSFLHNTARVSGGGAIVNGAGDGSVAPLFINCRFEQNRSLGGGGGLAYLGAAWVERNKEIDSCLFLKNKSDLYGGGLFYTDANGINTIEISNTNFIENQSNVHGGAFYANIGRYNGASVLIEFSNFSKNSAANASVFYILPNNFLYTKNISLNKCNIEGNYTFDGTGSSMVIAPIFSVGKDEKCAFNNSKFISNVSSNLFEIEGYNDYNGARLETKSNLYIRNSANKILLLSLLSNIDISQEKMFNNINIVSILSAIQVQFIQLSNCLFYKNQGLNTLSKYYNFEKADTFQIKNSIFSQNIIQNTGQAKPPNYFALNNSVISQIIHKDFFCQSEISSKIQHSYFDTLDCSSLPPNIHCGPGILTGIDPMFVNPDSGDFRLQACSPLVDAGSNDFVSDSTDLAGLPRIRGGTVDIGAYEHQGPALAAAPQTQPSCPGGASGSVQVAVADACPPVQFLWQSGPNSGSGLSGLPPGDYLFTLTDARGYSAVFPATVPQGPPPTLTPVSTALLCGDTIGGSATALLSPAAPPLQFRWAGGSTDSLRTGLPAGAYPLTVTDANGCTASATAQVDKSGSLSISIDVSEISCHGSADGAFTVLPENGKPPYAWTWANGASGPTLAPLGPGAYEGTLTDALGCTIQWVLPLGEPAPLLPNGLVTNSSDSSAANGSIELLPTGGTAPYQVLWNTGSTAPLLDSLAPGIYTVTLTDAHDCVAVETYTVGVTSSVDEADPAVRFALYPNPAHDWVWLRLSRPARQDLPLRVLNAAGQTVLEGLLPAGSNSLALPLKGLPAGVYAVQVAGAGTMAVIHR